MKIDDLIDTIAQDNECRLLRPAGVPCPKAHGLILPRDLKRFYERCGGAWLFKEKFCGFRIVSPTEFTAANPVIFGKYYWKHREEIDKDVTAGWFIIGREMRTNEAITVNLNLRKNGYCYDSFWEVHGSENAKVIAKSFSELLQFLYEARGETLYWTQSNFNLGFAHDE